MCVFFIIEALYLMQNSNVPICASIFTIGSHRHCNFPLKDQPISNILCKIKHVQVLPEFLPETVSDFLGLLIYDLRKFDCM